MPLANGHDPAVEKIVDQLEENKSNSQGGDNNAKLAEAIVTAVEVLLSHATVTGENSGGPLVNGKIQ